MSIIKPFNDFLVTHKFGKFEYYCKYIILIVISRLAIDIKVI